MSGAAILITQCLQNDFVKPIGRFDPMPNLLHVGHEEAKRLMGENPAEGPVARMMTWVYAQPDAALKLIHIRDWHDPENEEHAKHLEHFGCHCIQKTEGAEFAFSKTTASDKDVAIIDSLSLNDFLGTDLHDILSKASQVSTRVGIVGVWTEAKISFLAYELRTRFPQLDLAICSALCASSSTAQHFIALEQLEKILGVRIIPSLGEFVEFLGGASGELPLIGYHDASQPKVILEGEASCGATDLQLLRYLFRDCREVRAKTLDGGFSGNVVLGTQSTDLHGHAQVPHVLKIGPRDLIGKERTAFERIDPVLGNNAPQIADFADLEDRGALKYRYASMGGAFSTTFQKLYMKGLPQNEVERILRTVFVEQLGRFYKAKTRERGDLLEYYWFMSKYAPGVRSRVEALLDDSEIVLQEGNDNLRFAGDAVVPDITLFYSRELDRLARNPGDSHYFSYVHGDLNGANIIVDAQNNVWLIDFFHTHRGHILKDLIKLENDLLYIFTPLGNIDEYRQALLFTDVLLEVDDLGKSLPEAVPSGFTSEQFVRAYKTVRYMRSLYAELVESDRDPLQLEIGQLRYAVHTLSFDECNDLQKKWALYTACRLGVRIRERLESRTKLRIDWLDSPAVSPGRIGLSILPGRKDYYRDLEQDLETLRTEGVTHVVSLSPTEELEHYGVSELLSRYRELGFELYHLPILDQGTCTTQEMQALIQWVAQRVAASGTVFMHCVGGLGRSGLVAACYLKAQGMTSEAATRAVRESRHIRALESARQEAFLEAFSQQ